MALPSLDAPFLRALLLGVLAVGLITGPLWVSALPLGGTVYEYDRAEVLATDEGIVYAEDEKPPVATPISEDVHCTEVRYHLRPCAFESHLRDAGSIPTSSYTNSLDGTSPLLEFRRGYTFVDLDDGVYRAVERANESAQREDGLYRIDLELEPVAAADVLETVSIDVEDGAVGSVVADAADGGSTTAASDVDGPETPIRTENGSYYRVYQSGQFDDPVTGGPAVDALLTYVAPIVGLLLLVHVARRFEVSYDDEYR